MPDPSLLETFPTPGAHEFLIEHVSDEFTSLCPKTGHPDFGQITLRYEPSPAGGCVELKSLKLYYQSFRDEGIFYEAVTNRIRDDLVAALDPRWLQVVTEWRGRGGIRSRIIADHGAVPAAWPGVTSMPRALLFATSNPHKLEEVRAILGPLGYRVLGLGDVGAADAVEPDEDGATFADNARLKARYYARFSGHPCLADDSGLVVDALDGAPGVHSARYAGTGASRAERDRANNERLLRELAGVPAPARTARFVCRVCLVDASGSVLAETEGCFEGVVTTTPSGAGGFGYDPLLHLPDAGCTVAELTGEQKNARSHRGVAVRALARWLASSSKERESANPRGAKSDLDDEPPVPRR